MSLANRPTPQLLEQLERAQKERCALGAPPEILREVPAVAQREGFGPAIVRALGALDLVIEQRERQREASVGGEGAGLLHHRHVLSERRASIGAFAGRLGASRNQRLEAR
jgi:hypothetical protein